MTASVREAVYTTAASTWREALCGARHQPSQACCCTVPGSLSSVASQPTFPCLLHYVPGLPGAPGLPPHTNKGNKTGGHRCNRSPVGSSRRPGRDRLFVALVSFKDWVATGVSRPNLHDLRGPTRRGRHQRPGTLSATRKKSSARSHRLVYCSHWQSSSTASPSRKYTTMPAPQGTTLIKTAHTIEDCHVGTL